MGLTECNVQNMKPVISFDFCRIWPFILEHIHKVFIKISVFWIRHLKILGRIGKLIFFGEKYNFMHFERHIIFQNA